MAYLIFPKIKQLLRNTITFLSVNNPQVVLSPSRTLLSPIISSFVKAKLMRLLEFAGPGTPVERKVHMANSAQRKSLLPQQSHSSRRSLYPSIERAPSLSSSVSEPEPEFANDHCSKNPISDDIGGTEY